MVPVVAEAPAVVPVATPMVAERARIIRPVVWVVPGITPGIVMTSVEWRVPAIDRWPPVVALIPVAVVPVVKIVIELVEIILRLILIVVYEIVFIISLGGLRVRARRVLRIFGSGGITIRWIQLVFCFGSTAIRFPGICHRILLS